MVTTQAFYTIPEAEVVYYNLGQPSVKFNRLHPQQVITNNITSPLLKPHWNFSHRRNTHATHSEKYYKQRGNIVSFLLSLEIIYQNPRFTGMKGNFS